ncbi:MAG: M48 family metallopeptidase [Prevotellaceae bacterium]|jgi:predicted Zn-dependent protease|nr:M48 family metallopeptidase [Prevotellaceae bacterium]
MKKISLLLLIAACIWSCSSVPITGRKQLMLVSETDVLASSFDSYSAYMKAAKKSTDKNAATLVTKVGQRIADAVEYYYKSNGMEEMIKSYAWEFNLVEDENVNAFCMPGGKIVVYTGILPVTQDETGLAVVLGHEVAHAVAKHANERMSQQMVIAYGAEAVTSLLGNTSDKVKSIGGTVLGLGAQFGVMLPFSRKHELEADHLGLIFMAIAGYNPEAAVPFWQRMSQPSGSAVENTVLEFFSTHPSGETRIADIQKELPEVMEIYNALWENNKSTNTNNTNTKPANIKTDEKWHF